MITENGRPLNVPQLLARTPSMGWSHDPNRINPVPSSSCPRAGREPSPWLALSGLSLCMLMAALDTSITNVALPTMTQAFGVSFQSIQWVVLAYLLTITTLIVSVGRLGDMVGRRRLILIGLLVFTVASAACGAAPTLWLLVAARAAQGVGAAVMMSLSLAFVGAVVSREKIGSAIGLLGTMSAAGTAIGPSLGGVLIAASGWRAIFFVNPPLALLALVLVFRSLPTDIRNPGTDRPGFDLRGTLLLALTLGAYALAMTIGHGRFGAVNFGLLVTAVVGIALFRLDEKSAASPLIQLTMLGDHVVSSGLAMSTLVSTVMMSTLVVGPFYLSHALGLGSARVGLLMSVGPFVVALTGVPAGRIVDRVGSGRMTYLGLLTMLMGATLLAVLPSSIGVPGYLMPIIVITFGYGLFQTTNNTAVMKEAHPDQRGVISGLLSLSRNLGLITGASVMGAVFALASGTSEVAIARPNEVATGMRTTFGVAAVLLGLALIVARRPRDRAAHQPIQYRHLRSRALSGQSRSP